MAQNALTSHKRHTKKGTKWVDLIFEVEKLKIFQLQKLNQPEKALLKHAFCTQYKTVCVKCQSRTNCFKKIVKASMNLFFVNVVKEVVCKLYQFRQFKQIK
jgi:hypothetical protein